MSKSVFITGASSGLGLSHAIYLVSKGYQVIGTSRNAKSLNLDTLKDIYLRDHTKFGFIDKAKTHVEPKRSLAPRKIIENLNTYLKKIKFVSMDVTSSNSVTKAFKEFNPFNIDVLILNAGNGIFGPIEELSIDIIQTQFEVNLFGNIRVLKHVIPSMRERSSGQIITTSSLSGIICTPFQSMYSATKAALLRLTESLKIELRPFNIKVSSLLPGDINTAFDANTVMLHHPEESFISDEIARMLTSNPVKENSPYQKQGKIVWDAIIRNLIVSPPPILVSRKIEKIINAKRPKIHYKVGSRLQANGITFIKRVLPENLALRIMSMVTYGI